MDELNLADLRSKCLASLYSCAENISKYIEDENEKGEEINNLKTCAMEYAKMELEDEANKMALVSVERGSDITDWDSLQKLYEDQLAQYSNLHANLGNHPFVRELDKKFEHAERSQRDQGDLAITETMDTHIDPLSKRPINIPVRNTICNHLYEKDTIESIIKNKRNKGCPYLGCTNKQILQAQHLELDEELQLTIQQRQRASQDS